MSDYRWILTERVTGEVRTVNGEKTGDTWIGDSEKRKEVWLSLSADGTELLFDGRYVDVGDDFAAYLGVLDEIANLGFSEPYDEGDSNDGSYAAPDARDDDHDAVRGDFCDQIAEIIANAIQAGIETGELRADFDETLSLHEGVSETAEGEGNSDDGSYAAPGPRWP